MHSEHKINLPTVETATISHRGKVILKIGVELKKVRYVPSFTHNLLSVQRLTQDGGYKVIFHSKYCATQNPRNNDVIGLGRADRGLYYLMNEPLQTESKYKH